MPSAKSWTNRLSSVRIRCACLTEKTPKRDRSETTSRGQGPIFWSMNLFVRNEARRLARSASACALALLLSACSTVRPWINEPIAPDASVQPMVRPMIADDLWTGAHHEYVEMGKVMPSPRPGGL